VVNFRDSQLHQIFKLSLSTLLNLIQGKNMLNIGSNYKLQLYIFIAIKIYKYYFFMCKSLK